MIHFKTTVLHALLICIPFSIFALVSFWLRPRLWLHSLPPDIVRSAGPKTAQEKRLTMYLLLPLVLLLLPGLSIASTVSIVVAEEIQISFLGILVHIYGIWIVVHVWDFIVIDGGSMIFIDKNRPPIAGTEGASGWKDYRFHFRSMMEAILKTALFAVPASAVLYLLLNDR